MANLVTNCSLVILVLFLKVSRSWTLSCYNRNKFLNLEYCYGSENDCCGYYSYQYCCYTAITTGAIVGIVIGSLIGFAILVGLVICCCCAINKSTGVKGRVVNPVGGGVTVVNTAAHQQAWGGPVPTHGYHPYGGGMYGQPYPGPAPAPIYSHPAPGAVPGPSSDPVYPPPPAYQPPMDGQKT